MRRHSRIYEALGRYAAAVVAAVAACAASYETIGISTSSPWVFFFGAIIVSAWYGGRGPCLLATAGSVLLGRYFFMDPLHSFSLPERNGVPLLVFVGVSLAIGSFAAARRRAEAHGHAERRRFQATVMSIADAVVATDAARRVEFMNGVAEKLTGWRRADAVGRLLEEVFAVVKGASGEAAVDPFDSALKTGRVQGRRKPTVLTSRDGSERPVEYRESPIRDDRGDASGVVVVFRDVTEEYRAERERQDLADRLAAHARLFDSALSNAPDFMCTFDAEARLTYANRGLLALWGREAREVVGKDVREVGSPAESADRLARLVREVIEKKSRLKDEQAFPTALGRRHFEYIFVPVIGPDGRVEAVVASARDVTERKRVERATRRRAEMLQRLAEAAARVNVAHDVDSIVRVVAEEARQLVGARRAGMSLSLDPARIRPVSIVAAGSSLGAAEACPVIEAEAFAAALVGLHAPIRLPGDRVAVDLVWQALRDAGLVLDGGGGWLVVPILGRSGPLGLLQLVDGEFTEEDEAVLVQLSRITAIAVENAGLYERLRLNDRRKDEFLAMLAHELRNPLAAVVNAVDLATRFGTRENIDWCIEVVSRQTQHLVRHIDDLLDVSRISRGKIDLRRAVLEISPILDGAAQTARRLLEQRRHTLELAVERGNLWVDVDPTRLEQVVVNLLNNAAKYSDDGKRILLSARREADEVMISVKDEGVGIPPERLPEMFELFAQGDRSPARSEGGLGIGLTIVKKLVELHGGGVAARSGGPGQGSEFTIRLPAAAPPNEPAPSVVTPASTSVARRRILVVDDNADLMRGLVRLLTVIGHQVATAEEGCQAVRTAREFLPDVVLLDIGLPGMDGYEVAARLRREHPREDVVIVAISGYGQEEDRRRTREAGFDHHLVKPLDHNALVTLLSAAGDRRA